MGFTNSSGEAHYLCFARIQAVTATLLHGMGENSGTRKSGFYGCPESGTISCGFLGPYPSRSGSVRGE